MKNIKYIHRNPKGWQFRRMINGVDVSVYIGDNKYRGRGKSHSLYEAIKIRNSFSIF